MDDNAVNHFNFVIGILGFAVTIASTALCCRAYLPATRMKILDELLKETRTIYEKAEADDLFPSGDFREVSLTTLTEMEEFGASLRESTYNATTVVQEYLALLNGLSRRIVYLSVRVKDLRASLISTSEKERRNRRAGNARHSAHLNATRTDNTAVSQLTPVDPSIDSERSSRNSHTSRGSDRHRGRSASCPSFLNESGLRDSLERLGEHRCQGIDQEDASGGTINSSLPLSKSIEFPSRSSTLTDTPGRGILHKTLDQFYEWTMSIHSNDPISDAPEHDHDIARLPV